MLAHSLIVDRCRFGILFLLYWLLIVQLPVSVPKPELEASWSGALSYFSERQFQFGREIIFTFGPLGFLHQNVYTGFLFAQRILVEFLLKGFIAFQLVAITRRLTKGWRVLLLFHLFFLSYASQDYLFYFAITLSLALLTESRGRNWQVACTSLFLACLSLSKFTFFVLAFGGVCIILIYLGWTKRWKHFALTSIGYFGGVLSFWTLAGQETTGLLTYLFSALEIAAGYQDTMFLPADPVVLSIGIVILAAMITTLLLVWASGSDRVKTAFCVLLFGQSLFISSKHGFVRADFYHIIQFFCYAPLVLTSTWALFSSELFSYRKPMMAITLIGSFLPYLGIILGGPIYAAVIFAPAALTNMKTNLSALTEFPAYLDSMNDRLRVAKFKYELPKVKALVGSETLDVFGSEQGVALLNDFNYRPRPVFQSYSAYNEFLILANRRFYQGPKSPRFVLMKLQTIDGRIVAGDDSAALEFILRYYQPLLAERGYLLLKKRDLPNVFLERSLVERKSVKFSDRIDIPASDSNYWIQIAWQTNWRGKLQEMIYQPSEVMIELTDQDGSLHSYRLTHQIASTGFLLQPFLNETSDVVEALSGKSIPRVKSIRLLNESGNLAESFDYKLYSNPKFPTETTTGINPLDLKYWSLKTLPHSVKTSNKSATILVNEEYAFLAPAPSEILFDIPESAQHVQGYIGLTPFLKDWQPQLNRADFFIELVDQDQQKELFHRTLAPEAKATDRGRQFFNIELPFHTRGQLRLRATIPLTTDATSNRTYWSDIQFK